jgi:NAD(P)-dependent dehydrogenase (short-subunit alcohol dehydrogenase family)
MNVMNTYSLDGKVAIVTGALGLIGRQHCTALAEAGANVVVVDLNQELCNEFAETLPKESIGVATDITDQKSVENLRDKTIEVFGRIDVLVNNAAINDMVEKPTEDKENSTEEINYSMFENYPVDLFRKVMDVNVTGMFLCSQVLGTEMARQGSGSIINIASTYGIVAPDQSLYIEEDGSQTFFKSASYPTAKGAVIAFTKFLAAYWGSKGVRVNTLSPGGVENGQNEFFVKNYSKKTPLGRMAQSSDYKGGLVYLASDASSYMTGNNLVIDGGWTAW